MYARVANIIAQNELQLTMWIESLNAGLVKRTHSQIWNSNNVFRIGISFKYKDEKCFNKVQKLLSEFMNNTEKRNF